MNVEFTFSASPNEKFGIVVQGPLKLQDDFTLETVRLYRKYHPSAEIVVSTWEGQESASLQALRNAGAVVIESPDPSDNPGVLNVNRQIRSTLAGILACKEMGLRRIFKTRTDQRICSPDVYGLCKGLQEVFPPLAPGQRDSLVCLAGSLFLPYAWSDQFQFGHVDDLVRFWSVPFDSRTEAPPFWRLSLRNHALQMNPEVYLTTHFLRAVGQELNWTVRDHWNILRDRTVVVDGEMLDLLWPKLDPTVDYPSMEMRGVVGHRMMSFSRWLCLRRGMEMPPPEEVLDCLSDEVYKA